jgi:hypothetical protein
LLSAKDGINQLAFLNVWVSQLSLLLRYSSPASCTCYAIAIYRDKVALNRMDLSASEQESSSYSQRMMGLVAVWILLAEEQLSPLAPLRQPLADVFTSPL